MAKVERCSGHSAVQKVVHLCVGFRLFLVPNYTAMASEKDLASRSFERDWAMQGDLRAGMTVEEVSRMPRTSTLPQFRFDDPDFRVTDEDLHPPHRSQKKVFEADAYPKVLQKLDASPPQQQRRIPMGKDPSFEHYQYLMRLGKEICNPVLLNLETM